jgi:hypothetical protein
MLPVRSKNVLSMQAATSMSGDSYHGQAEA